MNIEKIKAEAPDGATHYYPGGDTWKPHYIKASSDRDKTEAWLTGMVTGDCWNDLVAHAPIDKCVAL